jgi:nitrite reductase (NO-forming)
MLVVGLVVQVLVGALTYLVPTVLGGGPLGNRAMTSILDRMWVPRVVLANAGLALTLAPVTATVRTVGWTAAGVGLGSFLPLLGLALARGPHPPGRRS